MPQMLLPLFPDGVTHITPELAFIKRDGQITYFNGQMPVFVHDEADLCTFRLTDLPPQKPARHGHNALSGMEYLG